MLVSLVAGWTKMERQDKLIMFVSSAICNICQIYHLWVYTKFKLYNWYHSDWLLVAATQNCQHFQLCVFENAVIEKPRFFHLVQFALYQPTSKGWFEKYFQIQYQLVRKTTITYDHATLSIIYGKQRYFSSLAMLLRKVSTQYVRVLLKACQHQLTIRFLIPNRFYNFTIFRFITEILPSYELSIPKTSNKDVKNLL